MYLQSTPRPARPLSAISLSDVIATRDSELFYYFLSVEVESKKIITIHSIPTGLCLDTLHKIQAFLVRDESRIFPERRFLFGKGILIR